MLYSLASFQTSRLRLYSLMLFRTGDLKRDLVGERMARRRFGLAPCRTPRLMSFQTQMIVIVLNWWYIVDCVEDRGQCTMCCEVFSIVHPLPRPVVLCSLTTFRTSVVWLSRFVSLLTFLDTWIV